MQKRSPPPPGRSGQLGWGVRRGQTELEPGPGKKEEGENAMGVLLAPGFHQWEKSCFLQRKQVGIVREGKGWSVAGDRARLLVTEATS